jgi:acetyltransferase
MINEEQFDSIYLNFVTPPFVDCESVAREIVSASKSGSKPLVCNYMTDKQKWIGTSRILKEGGIPCFDFAETAAKALSALVRYNEIRSRKVGLIRTFDDVNKEIVNTIFVNAKSKQKEVLTAQEVYRILEAYKIPVAPWKVALNRDEVVSVAGEIGFPVVIKADSESIIHKSDVGGVVVNIRDSGTLVKVVETMRRNLGNMLNFFVQKYISQGMEVIVGAKAEVGVGHIIMFGLGGIFVEILKDVSFNINPVSDVEADCMISSLKASPLLDGFRGEKGINKIKTKEIIQRISQLVQDFPLIKDIELNPLISYGEEICAVDARIII